MRKGEGSIYSAKGCRVMFTPSYSVYMASHSITHCVYNAPVHYPRIGNIFNVIVLISIESSVTGEFCVMIFLQTCE